MHHDMKKYLLLYLFFIYTFQLVGKDVTIEQAKKVAETFLINYSGSGLKSSTFIELKDAGDIFNRNHSFNNLKSSSVKIRDIYIFNIGEKDGFIIVSGDDAAAPILGYSNSGSINADMAPHNLLKWLEGYKQQIQFIKGNSIESTEIIKGLWRGESNRRKSASGGVAPLIATQWGQYPYVNDKCPFDEVLQKHAVTGCPATAMAQIMKFWKYPSKGIGFHSYHDIQYGTLSANFGLTDYDWEAMPNNVTGPNDAVATLMYHCGVAVEMSYGVNGSGSYVIKDPWAGYTYNQTVEHALPTYFGYDAAIKGLKRVDYPFEEQWKAILKAELDAGRPIQYAGYGGYRGGSGHTFVCDGYNDMDYFHMNWGWSGEGDGYFLLNYLNPGTHSFNYNQQALIGIKPSDATPSFKLEIYNNVQTNKPTIAYNEGFTISTNIINNGSIAFSGDFCAAVFDSKNNFIDYVNIISGCELEPGHHYVNDIQFINEGTLSILPGNYFVYIFYRPTNGSWNIIRANGLGIYNNDYTYLRVIHENPISLFSPINIQTNPIYSHGPLSVSLDIINNSFDEFNGSFVVALYTLEGTFVTQIEEKAGMNLHPYNHYTYGLTFSTDSIEASPGTYLLAISHARDEQDYYLTGSTSSYINPIKIIIKGKPYEKDKYEDNDTIAKAYLLTENYSNDSLNIKTIGSNIHSENDIDFYSINLENGYTYDIDLKLHDAYDSINDNSYTVDALLQYSLDGTNWSDTYDNIVPSPVIASGNKTLYCVVLPYFLGETGTYLLDINIKKTTETPTAELFNTPIFSVYPNPANNWVTISSSEKFMNYAIFDSNGKKILKGNLLNNDQFINVSQLMKGAYYLKITGKDKTLTKKIIKE